jgi:hypothetical protein
MAKQLIINADDLGYSPGITDGILRSFREGILTSATLMTTMPDRDRAIDLAGAETKLGVGVHLCLTQGVPLTSCRRISGRDGRLMRSLPKLFLKLRSSAARAEARDEMIAQIEYARGRGVRITHVDSHKHVAHLPLLHQALIDACRHTGIRWIRTAREISVPGTPSMSPAYRLLAACAKKLARRSQEAGLHTTDWFFGLATTGCTDLATIEALAKAAPDGLGELMVHPGYINDIRPGYTRLLEQRVAEMNALCDSRARGVLKSADIELCQYGDSSPHRPNDENRKSGRR